MAATLAKALRGGRSGVSSGLLPAIVRRVPQEGMLPQAYPAVGMGRLMHTVSAASGRFWVFWIELVHV